MSKDTYKKKNTTILYFATFLCVAFCFAVLCMRTHAQTGVLERPQIDPGVSAEITIDLEDESRFMGVSLYKIGEYGDGKFYFKDIYSQLDITPYYKMSRQAEIDEAGRTIAAYIKEEKISPDAEMLCQKGVLNAKNLSVGIYLAIQNEEDFNASLDRAVVIEVPTWSDETEEYLYDVRVFPKWEREVWFSFRPEVVYPTVRVIALCIALMLCILGPSVLRGVFFSAVSISAGILGMKLAEYVNTSFLSLMVFFVSFAFFGLALITMIYMMISPGMKKLKIHGWVQRNQFWIVPLIGAAAFSIISYLFFVSNVIVCVVIFVVLSGLGIYLQYLKKDRQVKFYTYDDLLAENAAEESES